MNLVLIEGSAAELQNFSRKSLLTKVKSTRNKPRNEKTWEKKTLRSLLNFAFPTLLFEGIPSFSSLQ